ncbi:MAG TPA: DUF6055 domain-containing protein [bacterium]|nr:DUF6055 domain-containing protein [bacterium]
MINRLFVFIILTTTGYTFAQGRLSQTCKDHADGIISDQQAYDTLHDLLTTSDSTPIHEADKCGFPAIQTLQALSQKLNKSFAVQKKSAAFVYNHAFVTGSGKNRTFKIYYDTVGTDKVSTIDADANTIPDWVEENGKAFEKSYRKEIDTMGYREPVNMKRDGYYEVYIINIRAYGQTAPVQQYPSGSDTWESFIEIENDFVGGGFKTHGYDAMRVTAAHEFHHAIQLAYKYDTGYTDGWFYEMTSTWLEDVVYDEVNDYYAYLPRFYSNPHVSLFSETTFFGYHVTHWLHMMEKTHGASIVRNIWERMPDERALIAINNALEAETSTDLRNSFTEFSIWNYFTKDRYDSITYFQESRSFPAVSFYKNTLIGNLTYTDGIPGLAARYYNFKTFDSSDIKIRFESGSPSDFNIITIERLESGDPFITRRSHVDSFVVSHMKPGDSLIVIVSNTTTNKTNTTYTISTGLTDGSSSHATVTNLQIYPNPIRMDLHNTLNIKFDLRKTASVVFEVYSISGKRMVHHNYGKFDPNNHLLNWDIKDNAGKFLPSGIYIYRLNIGDYSKTGKIAVVR